MVAIRRACRAFVLMSLAAPSAAAFNYPEHAWLTEQGIAALVEAHPQARELLSSIRRVINSERLCQGDELLTLASDSCFGLPDLPALAADHSSSPAALLARWFAVEPEGQLKAMVAGLERVNSALLVNVGAAITNADPGNDQPPECGEPTAPDGVAAFNQAIRKYRVVPGTVTPTADLDTDLGGIDGDYLCLALNGSHHFRVPGMSLHDAAYAQTPNAIGAYTNYHLAALSFARLSLRDPANRDRWRGLAVLSEMFALHFIEDAVAAGHAVVDYGTLNPASIKATHDGYNKRGLIVRVSEAACNAIDSRLERFPRLSRVCWPGSEQRGDWIWRTARVRGDGAISGALGKDDVDDVTSELVTLLVSESLEEVVAAALDPSAELGGPCLDGLVGCVDPAPGRSLELSCTLQWFSVPACEPRRTAVKALQDGELAVLEMVPSVAERAFPSYVFSGHALTLGSMYRIATLSSFGRIVGIGRGEKLGAESLNAVGVGWAYTTPPTPSGAFTLGVIMWLPVLRTSEIFGAGGGLGVRLDWLPSDQFFMLGLGVSTEATDLWTDDQSISSFFHASVGSEIVNTDRVSFRLTADLGWHVSWGNESSFAAGLSLSLQFKVGSSSRGAH